MPFSPFDDLGFWELGADQPSYAELIYDQMCQAVGSGYDLTPGTYQEAKIYATAMLFGHARVVLESARNQRLPGKVTDLLDEMEKDYGIVSGNDSPEVRRARLEARRLLMRGAREEAIVTELKAVLGTSFVKLRVRSSSERSTWPADPGIVGAFPPPDRTPKYFRLLDSVLPGSVKVPYERLNGSERPLIGESLCIEPEVNSVTERVVVTDVANTDAVVAAEGEWFVAAFAQPHTVGAMALNAKPVWMSTAREVLVIVTTTAARDAETRRKIHEVMARHMKTTTRWNIVETPDRTTMGPFIVGVSKVGTVPIGPTAVPI